MSAKTPMTEGNPVRFVVEEGAVRQFRLAAQSADKPNDDTAPWTFPMAVAHWLGPEDKVDTGLDLARLLHGGQEFVYPDGPLEPGTELFAQESIVDRFEKRGSRGGLMKFVVVETTFKDTGSGNVVAYMRRTLIEREGAPS